MQTGRARLWREASGKYGSRSVGIGTRFYPAVRFIAVPVNVDPLGSRAIGASVFPVAFLGRFAIRPEPTGELNGRLTELPMCIPPPWPPRASANVLGTVNAIASAIVVYFMAISFTCEIGDDRTLTTKFFFSAIEAAKLFTFSKAKMFQQSSSIASHTR